MNQVRLGMRARQVPRIGFLVEQGRSSNLLYCIRTLLQIVTGVPTSTWTRNKHQYTSHMVTGIDGADTNT